jgi:hypothetical protein
MRYSMRLSFNLRKLLEEIKYFSLISAEEWDRPTNE